MLHYSALVLAFVVAVRTIPVDEIFARNGIDGQAGGSSVFAAASNCTGSPVDCSMREFSGTSLLKIASGECTEATSLYVNSNIPCRKCRGSGRRSR